MAISSAFARPGLWRPNANNIEVMWLINRLKADFKAIADLRKHNKPAFITACRAFVQFCRAAGLIAGDRVAIDGSTFQEVASSRRHKGDRIYQATISDCAGCALKAQCTTAKCRYVSRHAQKDVFERMAQRMQLHPEMMERRKSIVEHPFGSLKQWLLGTCASAATTRRDKS